MGQRVTICDVGPRDGLQNDAVTLEPVVRAELIDRLASTGVPRIEAVSFVHPERVPQMAGAEEVVAAANDAGATVLAGLVLNERGYDRLLATGLREAHFAFAVTETFNTRNQGASVTESVAVAGVLAGRAREDGIRLSVTLSVAFGCPFEGRVDPGYVADLASQVASFGPDELCLADTIGVAVPGQVRDLVERVLPLGIPLGGHFHNTRSTGYVNALAAVEAGVVVLDASIGGLGGCPFAPRATGNIATEDLIYLLDGEGIETGVDLGALIEVAVWLEELLGRRLEGQLYRAGQFPRDALGKPGR